MRSKSWTRRFDIPSNVARRFWCHTVLGQSNQLARHMCVTQCERSSLSITILLRVDRELWPERPEVFWAEDDIPNEKSANHNQGFRLTPRTFWWYRARRVIPWMAANPEDCLIRKQLPPKRQGRRRLWDPMQIEARIQLYCKVETLSNLSRGHRCSQTVVWLLRNRASCLKKVSCMHRGLVVKCSIQKMRGASRETLSLREHIWAQVRRKVGRLWLAMAAQYFDDSTRCHEWSVKGISTAVFVCDDTFPDRQRPNSTCCKTISRRIQNYCLQIWFRSRHGYMSSRLVHASCCRRPRNRLRWRQELAGSRESATEIWHWWCWLRMWRQMSGASKEQR